MFYIKYYYIKDKSIVLVYLYTSIIIKYNYKMFLMKKVAHQSKSAQVPFRCDVVYILSF